MNRAFRFGSSLAALQFLLGVGLPVRRLIKSTKAVNTHKNQSSERYISATDAADIFVQQELLPVTNYLPDVEVIKTNGVRVFVAAGEWGLERKRWYAQTAQILAEQLGCELAPFPGHHGSFMDMPVEWAATLRRVLRQAEEQTHESRSQQRNPTPLQAY
jgi:hypothetical protein